MTKDFAIIDEHDPFIPKGASLVLKHFLQQHSAKYNGRKKVYQEIHAYGPITKTNLVEKTQMKQTTVTRHLEYLLRENFIRISEYEESSGGRPPALYEISPNAAYIIGIDLSRTESMVSLVNMAFETIDNFSFRMTELHTPAYCIHLIKEKIAEFLKKYQLQEDDLLGIGIGTVGPLDREKGMILEPSGFIASGWRNIHLTDQLRTAEEDVILLENGANAAALYEFVKSNQQDETLLYCISGRGLRCGVLTDGRILKTKTGDASSYGEMIMDRTERKSLSSLISYDFLVQELNKRYAAGKDKSRRIKNEVDMTDFLSILEQADPVAKEVAEQSAITYGIGLANMINILHPDKVVLSSELIHRFPAYFEKIVETAKHYIYRIEREPVQFAKGNRKESSISTGAAVLVYQYYFE